MSNRAGRRATAGAMIGNYRARFKEDNGRECRLHDDVVFAIIDGAPVMGTGEEQDIHVLACMFEVDKDFRIYGVRLT